MDKRTRILHETHGKYRISSATDRYFEIEAEIYTADISTRLNNNKVCIYYDIYGLTYEHVIIYDNKFLPGLIEYINMGPLYDITDVVTDCDLLFKYVTLVYDNEGVGEYEVTLPMISQGDVTVEIINKVHDIEYTLCHGDIKIQVIKSSGRSGSQIEFAKGLIAKYCSLHRIVRIKSAAN